MIADPSAEDLYRRLGLPRTASKGQIRRAFRCLALRWHPDRGGSAGSFIRLREAHDVLADPARRAAFDRNGADRSAPARRGAPGPPLFGGARVKTARDGRVTLTAVIWGLPLRIEFGGGVTPTTTPLDKPRRRHRNPLWGR